MQFFFKCFTRAALLMPMLGHGARLVFASCSKPPVLNRIAVILFMWVLAGCATNVRRDARELAQRGQFDAAIELLVAAQKSEPDNFTLRAELMRTKEIATQQTLLQADNLRSTDNQDAATAAYLKALSYDADNTRAKDGLRALDEAAKHRRLIKEALEHEQAGRDEPARVLLRQVLREDPRQRDARALLRKLDEAAARKEAAEPQLKLKLDKPITFDLRDATLKTAFDFITRVSGLNVFFDKDVKTDQRVSVYAKDTPVLDLVQLILVTNQLERKVVSESSVLVYPATPQKLREYQDLVSRTFYLSNADVKQVQNLIKTMVKTKDVYIDEKLNMLVMRDTPEAVRYAERLVAANDLAEPEVMLQVEVMEIARNRFSEIGIRWPEQAAITALGSANAPNTLSMFELLNANSRLFQTTLTPGLLINLRQQDGSTNLLANPRIRVKNREKARILIGDRVPVITSTSTSTGFVSESVTYLDVGIKLEVESNVFLEDEVQMKVGLEVSNIAREVRSSSGTLTYQVGTRNANTTLRLRDGETQVLAGLINDEDRRQASKVPGLSALPLLGRLFSSDADTRSKTEIVLLITPRVLRNLQRPDGVHSEFYAGTEAAIGTKPLYLKRMADASVATGTAAATAADANTAPAAASNTETPAATPPAAGTDAAANPAANAAAGASAAALNSAGATAGVGVSPVPGAANGADAANNNSPSNNTPPPNTAPPPNTGPPGPALLTWTGPQSVKLGQVFEVTLQLSALQPLASLPMQLMLDPAALQFVDAQPGDFFARNGGKAAISSRTTDDGQVQLTVAGDPNNGASGQGQLLVLRLRALTAAPAANVAMINATAVRAGSSARANTPAAVEAAVALPPPLVIRITP